MKTQERVIINRNHNEGFSYLWYFFVFQLWNHIILCPVVINVRTQLINHWAADRVSPVHNSIWNIKQQRQWTRLFQKISGALLSPVLISAEKKKATTRIILILIEQDVPSAIIRSDVTTLRGRQVMTWLYVHIDENCPVYLLQCSDWMSHCGYYNESLCGHCKLKIRWKTSVLR